MNTKDLVYAIRKEAMEIDELIKKLKKRSDNLDSLADDLEAPERLAAEKAEKTAPPNQFRKIVDSIYGEKPKRKSK